MGEPTGPQEGDASERPQSEAPGIRNLWPIESLLVIGALIAIVLVFLAIGHYYPGSGGDVIDWKPTRSPELEAELELRDIDEMLEAQNERRRRSGRPEMSELSVHAELEAERRARAAATERYRREREEGGAAPREAE